MFENLSTRLSQAARNISGKGRLSESNIKDTLRQVRLALLEADVALPVVKGFIEKIRESAIGDEVGKSLTPGQALVKIIHRELVAVLGSDTVPLDLRAQPPVVLLLAGLQGAGKTTTAAKLAGWFRKKGKLPAQTESITYDLEYGTDRLEVHLDAVGSGAKVLMVDDLLATGGTMAAACKLIERIGGQVAGIVFLIELAALRGAEKISDYEVTSIISFE